MKSNSIAENTDFMQWGSAISS